MHEERDRQTARSRTGEKPLASRLLSVVFMVDTSGTLILQELCQQFSPGEAAVL